MTDTGFTRGAPKAAYAVAKTQGAVSGFLEMVVSRAFNVANIFDEFVETTGLDGRCLVRTPQRAIERNMPLDETRA